MTTASSESLSETTEGDLDFLFADGDLPSSGEGPAKLESQ